MWRSGTVWVIPHCILRVYCSLQRGVGGGVWMPHSRPRAVNAAQEWPSGAWHMIAGGSLSRNMLVFLLQACSTSGQRCHR